MDPKLLLRFEREARRLEGELPVDVFLPDLEALHLAGAAPAVAPAQPVAGPEPAASPEQASPLGTPFSERPEASPRRRRQPSQGRAQPAALDEEVQAFMNRDQRGIAEDDDLSEFLGGIDPNID